MIRVLPKTSGPSTVAVICDDCGREEIVPAKLERSGRDFVVANEAQPITRVESLGWAKVKGKVRCMSCEAKRKAASAAPKKSEVAMPAGQGDGPTREQKREILELLQVAYDADAGRYRGADTDASVAAAVAGAMPGWVAALRVEFFGEGGGNESAASFDAEIADMVERVKAVAQDVAAARQASDDAAKVARQLAADAAALERRHADLVATFDRRVGGKVGAR